MKLYIMIGKEGDFNNGSTGHGERRALKSVGVGGGGGAKGLNNSLERAIILRRMGQAGADRGRRSENKAQRKNSSTKRNLYREG